MQGIYYTIDNREGGGIGNVCMCMRQMLDTLTYYYCHLLHNRLN